MKKKVLTAFGRLVDKIKKNKVFAVAIPVAIAVVVWLIVVLCDVFGWGFNGGKKVMVEIPDGCSVQEIAQILKKEDVIDFEFAFRLYEKLGDNHLFRKGGHILDKGMGYGEIIDKLTDVPDVETGIVRVVIPEGFEVRQIAERLAEQGLVDKERFIDEAENGEFDHWFVNEIKRGENRLEGYLFPATYEFYINESEHDIICRMLDTFEEKVVPLYTSADTEMTLDSVVTLASIVEREAANDGERKRIASVFYNRMDVDMTLSSCATVQYIIKERKPVLSNSDIQIKSDYNTYINKGLPVGPIASPGVQSVEAALFPEDSDYLYFAARADGSENVFSKTGEEHMRIVKELQGN